MNDLNNYCRLTLVEPLSFSSKRLGFVNMEDKHEEIKS